LNGRCALAGDQPAIEAPLLGFVPPSSIHTQQPIHLGWIEGHYQPASAAKAAGWASGPVQCQRARLIRLAFPHPSYRYSNWGPHLSIPQKLRPGTGSSPNPVGYGRSLAGRLVWLGVMEVLSRAPARTRMVLAAQLSALGRGPHPSSWSVWDALTRGGTESSTDGPIFGLRGCLHILASPLTTMAPHGCHHSGPTRISRSTSSIGPWPAGA